MTSEIATESTSDAEAQAQADRLPGDLLRRGRYVNVQARILLAVLGTVPLRGGQPATRAPPR